MNIQPRQRLPLFVDTSAGAFVYVTSVDERIRLARGGAIVRHVPFDGGPGLRERVTGLVAAARALFAGRRRTGLAIVDPMDDGARDLERAA